MSLPAPVQAVLSRVTTLSPGAALVIGLLVVGWGGGLWRAVQVGSGLAIGGMLGWQVGIALHSSQVGWVAAGAAGIGLAVVFYLVERAAVAGMGGASAVAVVDGIWPLVQHTQATWMVEALAALVGTVVAGLLHTRAVRVLTALAGAALVAWALGYPGNLLLIGGLGLAGALFQSRSAKPAVKSKKR